MEIIISKKITLALIILASISFYVSFIFNSCLVTSISKAIPKVNKNKAKLFKYLFCE